MTRARAVRALVAGLALAQAGAAAGQPPSGAVPGPTAPPASSGSPPAAAPSPTAETAAAPGSPPAATAPSPTAETAAAPAAGSSASALAGSSRQPGRTRFFGGLGAGAGLMGLVCGPSCEGMDGAAGLSGHAGLVLGSGLIVLYDASLLVHLDDSALSPVRVYYSTHLLALQGWLGPRVWVRGGPGLGHLRINHVGIQSRSEMAPTLGGALGVEVARADPIVFEGIVRVSAGFFDEDDGQDGAVYTLSIGAGASWY